MKAASHYVDENLKRAAAVPLKDIYGLSLAISNKHLAPEAWCSSSLPQILSSYIKHGVEALELLAH